jgi:hypothetical protein
MADESEIASLSRRVKLIEDDVEGERTVSRHILRKVTENENSLLELTKAVNRIEEKLVLFQAGLPRTIADIVSVTMREELSKLRKTER